MGDEYFGPPLPPLKTEIEEVHNNKDENIKLLEKQPRKRRRSRSSTSESSSNNSSEETEADVRKRSRLSTSSYTCAPKCYSMPNQPIAGDSANDFIGPVMPAGVSANKEEDNEDLQEWGPKPPGDDKSELQSTAEEIERRAQRMKNKILNPDYDSSASKPGREAWMTELPAEHGVNFAITARKFSMAVPCENKDRSVWTDTPADRVKKEQGLQVGKEPSEKDTQEKNILAQKDSDYSRQIEEYNKAKKRSKTLLELHEEKKMKEHKKHKKDDHKKKKKKSKDKEKDKKKEKKDKIPERRPFDRDVDLKANRLDNAQRQAIIKRSQQLTGRFGHGSTTGKFL